MSVWSAYPFKSVHVLFVYWNYNLPLETRDVLHKAASWSQLFFFFIRNVYIVDNIDVTEIFSCRSVFCETKQLLQKLMSEHGPNAWDQLSWSVNEALMGLSTKGIMVSKQVSG